MREILFKGKRKDNEEWVEGFLTIDPTICDYVIDIIGLTSIIIYPETVGQYTGLTDKNGKKIFEGDIVAIDHTLRTYHWDEIPETYKPRRSYSCWWDRKRDEMHYKRNYAVECKEKDARWILRNGSDQHNLRRIFLSMHNGVIIGNLHDNPELLKGAENNG